MPSSVKNLIVFFIPSKEIINGGIMSIFSLCKETRKLSVTHNTDVVLSVYPGLKSYRKNTLFKNSEMIYEFDELLKKYTNLDNIILHMPEGDVGQIEDSLRHTSYNLPKNIHINILNQNIDYMPTLDIISNLYTIASNVTQTTAHIRYCTQEIADRFGLPTHHFSVSLDKSQYKHTTFEHKENLIVYSPDDNPSKESILHKLRQNLKDYSFFEIKNLTYEEYKAVISRARYAITFGEGFDGYFIESIFSGSIPFSVYNETFFPDTTFKNLPNVVPTYDDLADSIIKKITVLDAKDYDKLSNSLIDKLTKFYSYDLYVRNIELFYKKQYTYQPTEKAKITSFTESIRIKNLALDKFGRAVTELNHLQDENNARINSLQAIAKEFEDLKSSSEWKMMLRLKKLKARIFR